MGGKTGGGAPQQQNMGAGGAGAGMNQMPSYSGGGKGGGGQPQNQMGQMGQRPDPAMLQQLQQYAQQRSMDQTKPMMGGVNSLQGQNMMPPPAAATGASPGGPLSGRFGGWGAQQRGMGWGGGGGMGRFGGMGRNFGGPPPPGGFGGGATPAGMPQGLANLQALAANQMAPTTGASLTGDVAPQPGFAAGGRVSWSPGAANFGGQAAGTGAGMFPSVPKLGAIAQPAAYVAQPQQAIWQPPPVAAKVAPKSNYNMMNMQGGGYWARDPNILANGVRFGGSGSHGGGRG
jgi:hypothetical protein